MRRKPLPKLQRIDEILARALRKRHVPFRLEDRQLREVWGKAVGPQIASQSRPEHLRGEILLVKVANSVWMQQLYFLKEEIIGKVNTTLGKTSVKDIRFAIGQLPVSPDQSHESGFRTPSTVPLKERDKKMMDACLDTLADQELKEIIRRVMTKEITWRRYREKRKVP
jgi:predicted nucleic acid-binding Zn ribbon protein